MLKSTEKSIERRLQQRADVRAGNGGLAGGQRTVRNDKTVYFDGHTYFSHNLAYWLRERVWVEYSESNYTCAVNIYNSDSGGRRLICSIDDQSK